MVYKVPLQQTTTIWYYFIIFKSCINSYNTYELKFTLNQIKFNGINVSLSRGFCDWQINNAFCKFHYTPLNTFEGKSLYSRGVFQRPMRLFLQLFTNSFTCCSTVINKKTYTANKSSYSASKSSTCSNLSLGMERSIIHHHFTYVH